MADLQIQRKNSLIAQCSGEKSGLLESAWEAVENKPPFEIGGRDAFRHAPANQVIGNEFAGVHSGPHRAAQLRILGGCGAKHVSGGEMHESESSRQFPGLGSLSAPGRSEQNNDNRFRRHGRSSVLRHCSGKSRLY